MSTPQRLFERTIELDDFLDSEVDAPILVVHRCEGTRAEIIKNKLATAVKMVEIEHRISTTSNSSTSASINDDISVYIDGNLEQRFKQETLYEMFIELRKYSPVLLMDISTMSVRLIALLLASLVEVYDYETTSSFARVFCGYTEPVDYHESFVIDNSGTEVFRFYKAYDPLAPIPGYYCVDANKAMQRIWAVLLGFEGNRVHLLQNELTNVKGIEAYITTPTMKLGWVNNVFRSNLHFLEGVDNAKPEIKYVSATSPFAVYNRLCELKRQIAEEQETVGLYIYRHWVQKRMLWGHFYIY